MNNIREISRDLASRDRGRSDLDAQIATMLEGHRDIDAVLRSSRSDGTRRSNSCKRAAVGGVFERNRDRRANKRNREGKRIVERTIIESGRRLLLKEVDGFRRNGSRRRCVLAEDAFHINHDYLLRCPEQQHRCCQEHPCRDDGSEHHGTSCTCGQPLRPCQEGHCPCW